jgi:uncharacterized protein YchJ
LDYATFCAIVEKMPNRVPTTILDTVVCPCRIGGISNDDDGRPILYKECCKPYHDNYLELLPETPERVLRTRYSAFVYRLIPYIIQTTHYMNTDYQSNPIRWAKLLHREGMFDSYNFMV